MSDKKMKIVRLTLIALIAITVLFAFIQSMLPTEVSSAESDAVGDIVEEIIPSDTPTGSYVQNNLRKIAHFIEFACLGTEVAIYLLIFMRKPLYVLFSYPLALITAFFDETIQIFSKRGPSISDVWIDFSGFLTLSLLVYFVYFASSAVANIYKRRKSELNDGKNN